MARSDDPSVAKPSAMDSLRGASARLSEEMRKERAAPGLLSRLTSINSQTTRMSCAGPDCPATGTTGGHLQRGKWSHSGGWRHEEGQNFCPICQGNGNMELALRLGQRAPSDSTSLHTSKPRL